MLLITSRFQIDFVDVGAVGLRVAPWFSRYSHLTSKCDKDPGLQATVRSPGAP